MVLPGNVARLGSADLIDFDAQPLQIMVTAQRRSLAAWKAAEDAERRFMMFDWLATFVPGNRNRLLFGDFATGFLLSYEVAVQHFMKEYLAAKRTSSKKEFFQWMQSCADPDEHGEPELYNIEMRGLRLMRHVSAHHQLRPLEVRPGEEDSIFRNPSGGRTARRHFTRITQSEFDMVANEMRRSKPLEQADLPAWNQKTSDKTARMLMHEGLRRLRWLLVAAETQWGSNPR